MRGENRTTEGLTDEKTLAIWSAGSKDTTYFTLEGQSFIDMVKGDLPQCFWRVIHGHQDTTKPFITKHIGGDMLIVIEETDPLFSRLLKAHKTAQEESE